MGQFYLRLTYFPPLNPHIKLISHFIIVADLGEGRVGVIPPSHFSIRDPISSSTLKA
jgi:hypothetical protein